MGKGRVVEGRVGVVAGSHGGVVAALKGLVEAVQQFFVGRHGKAKAEAQSWRNQQHRPTNGGQGRGAARGYEPQTSHSAGSGNGAGPGNICYLEYSPLFPVAS
ncbi:hypothetical protein GCM10027048_10040 [Hymenobacter coalescens]